MILSVRADTALYCNWAFSGKCSMVVAIQQIWLYNVRVFSWKCRMDLAIFPWACLLLFLLLFSDGDGFLMLFRQPLELFESSWRLTALQLSRFLTKLRWRDQKVSTYDNQKLKKLFLFHLFTILFYFTFCELKFKLSSLKLFKIIILK